MPQVGIRDHIAALEQELAWARSCIVSDKIDREIRTTVEARFRQDLEGQLELLHQLDENLGVHGHKAADSWRTLAAIRSESHALLQDCLSFLHGALFRSARMDRGICVIADAYFNEVLGKSEINWSRLTMMGEAEDIADRTDIVRIRFPDFSIWSIPILAHEAGHLVASGLQLKKQGKPWLPIQTFLDKQKDRRSHAAELFADLFATYAAGPALAMNSVLLRFDPSKAYRGSESHPPAAERVWFMVEAMRRINRSYAEIATELEDEWGEAIANTGTGGTLAPATSDRLEGWLEDLLGILDVRLSNSAYKSWAHTVGLVEDHLFDIDHAPEVAHELELVDVVNGAWLARFRRPSDVSAIGARALVHCTSVIPDPDSGGDQP